MLAGQSGKLNSHANKFRTQARVLVFYPITLFGPGYHAEVASSPPVTLPLFRPKMPMARQSPVPLKLSNVDGTDLRKYPACY